MTDETEAEIMRLYHGEKWPIGTIASQLGLHHTTVQRVLRQTGVDAKVVAPRPAMVDPFVPFIVEKLQKYPELTSSRIFGMIKERGYPGGPDHLRRIVGRLRPKKPAEAFQRLRTLPGEQAQVDWAHFGKLQIGRAIRPPLGVRRGAQLLPAALSSLLPRRVHALLRAWSRRGVHRVRGRAAYPAVRQSQKCRARASRRRDSLQSGAASPGCLLPIRATSRQC